MREGAKVGVKVEVREKRLLSAETFGHLLSRLAACQSAIERISGPTVRVMVLLAFITGFRISEVVGHRLGAQGSDSQAPLAPWQRGTTQDSQIQTH